MDSIVKAYDRQLDILKFQLCFLLFAVRIKGYKVFTKFSAINYFVACFRLLA